MLGHDGSESDVDEERSSKEEGARAIANALQRKENIEYVALSFAEPDMLPIVQSFASNKYLRHLLICSLGGSRSNSDAFIEAASRCENVEILEIYMRNESFLHACLQAIPQLRMRQVDIVLGGEIGGHGGRNLPQLLDALKQNFKLFSVKVRDYDDNVFLNENASEAVTDNRQFWRYLRRNKLLADWIQNPELVPKHLWPEALAIASQAGEEMLWQSLLKVGPEVADRRLKTRKRKRPQYYDPSSLP